MCKIYISGPMNGYPNHNIPSFNEAREKLILTGWEVLVPPVIDKPTFEMQRVVDEDRLTTPKEHATFLKMDIQLVLKADAIALLEGWPYSKGAKAELDVAIATGKTVYIYHDGFLYKQGELPKGD